MRSEGQLQSPRRVPRSPVLMRGPFQLVRREISLTMGLVPRQRRHAGANFSKPLRQNLMPNQHQVGRWFHVGGEVATSLLSYRRDGQYAYWRRTTSPPVSRVDSDQATHIVLPSIRLLLLRAYPVETSGDWARISTVRALFAASSLQRNTPKHRRTDPSSWSTKPWTISTALFR